MNVVVDCTYADLVCRICRPSQLACDVARSQLILSVNTWIALSSILETTSCLTDPGRLKIIILHYSTDIDISEVVNIFARKNPSRLKTFDILNSY